MTSHKYLSGYQAEDSVRCWIVSHVLSSPSVELKTTPHQIVTKTCIPSSIQIRNMAIYTKRKYTRWITRA